MNVFVLCVFGLFYSTQSASIPVTFNSKDDKIDDRGYPIFQHWKHLGERLYSEPENSSSVLVSKWISSSKVFPEELGENTEGDITNSRRRTRSVLKNPTYRWANNVIPYELSPSIGGRDYVMIQYAIEDFHRLTCLKFKPRSPYDEDYIYIENNTGECSSALGRQGGKQMVYLSQNCIFFKGIIIHELLHAVGFVHEQSRPDRETYVKINKENIANGTLKNFIKFDYSVVDNQEIPYDYKSVMHYPSKAFSINGEPTIEAKHSTMAPLGQRYGFSEGDLRKVRKMYPCPEAGINDWKITVNE